MLHLYSIIPEVRLNCKGAHCRKSSYAVLLKVYVDVF